jgi:probable rRNA maturation factor
MSFHARWHYRRNEMEALKPSMNFPDFPDFSENIEAREVMYHFEDVEFELQNDNKITSWLLATAVLEGKTIQELTYIFCSDEYLLQMNKEHLQHDYYTDVITFAYSGNPIAGDIFISTDRVKENAQQLSISFEQELHRVMVHGLLHLAGYLDKTPKHKAIMTSKEDFYLKNLSILSV